MRGGLPGVLGIIAEEAGDAAALRVGQRLAGVEYKFPSASTLARVLRDMTIRQEFDGRNSSELARKHGLSRMQVYRIVRKKN